jgi:type II secretory pathway component GspD/PulD (secretin)
MAQLSTLSVMTPDPRTNSLLLGGPPAAVQAAKDILRVLDVPTPSAPTVQVKVHFFARAGSLPQAWFNRAVTKSASDQPETQIVVLPDGDRMESLVREIKAGGGVLTGSPVVLTRDNVRAEITVSSSIVEGDGTGQQDRQLSDPSPAAGGVRFNVLPRLNTDGTITLSLSLMIADPSRRVTPPLPEKPNDSDGKLNDTEGQWKLVSRMERRVGQNDVLAVLKPEGNLQAGRGRDASLILINARVENGSHLPAPSPQ